MIETVYLFNCRSLTRPLWAGGAVFQPVGLGGRRRNLVLQAIFTYLPLFQQIFGTAAISLAAWGEIGGVALLAMLVMEGEKALRRKYGRK